MSDFECHVRKGLDEETRKDWREACCSELGIYGEHGDERYCVLHFPGEDKKDTFKEIVESKLNKNDYDFSGTVFPDGTSDFRGRIFMENVIFRGATFIGGADFRRAQFSGEATSFRRAQFSGERTDFSGARFSRERTTFRQAQFDSKRTDFSEAQFSAAQTYFIGARFGGEWTGFRGARFKSEQTGFRRARFRSERTSFRRAQFNGAQTYFTEAEFGSAETYFEDASFTEDVFFTGATFRERVIFWKTTEELVFGPQAQVGFDSCRLEKPELLTFNTVLLRPGWFINTDVRKVDFTNVKWYGLPGGPQGTLGDEIDALKQRGDIESPHTLLAQTCRRLSANAEENREYPLANEFHYWSMDALRIGRWRYLGWLRQFIKKNWRRISARFGLIATLLWIWRILRREPLRHTMPSRVGLVPTFYWALNGYGVRAGRAFWILVAMWAAFTTLYVLVDPSEFTNFGQGVGYRWQTAVYSLLALVRLNPEPRPEEPGVFQFLVGLEGILGPLQIALLALAVRRKVMR
jgi:uncharacterized protein YjbI with pentapeptide repeats